MLRSIKTVNCLYFPPCDDIPVERLINVNEFDSIEEYMDYRISSIMLPLEQSHICNLMAKIGNNKNVYIGSYRSTFIDELIIGLSRWSNVRDNTSMSIILNLACNDYISHLLTNDDLLVRPLMTIIRWMSNRGIEVTIGLPLSHAFYPHTYDVHILDGDYDVVAAVHNMTIILRSRISLDRIAVIDRGVLTIKDRFNHNESVNINKVIINSYSNGNYSSIIRSYKRLMR